jgi:poly-gamma-glutamate capsule biosynthesis protein CapA/YwtB (metallophosphatase superfamily)
VLTLLLACTGPVPISPEPPAPAPALEPAPAPAPAPAVEPVTVTLAAVGDVLPHRRVKSTAQAHGWSTVFGEAAPLLQAADIAFANLEGPIAPDHDQGVHDEVFNAPATLAPALSEAGIDLVSMANNHAFDQGPQGLVETWTRVREAGVATVGAGPTCADATEARILTVRGLRVAFLAAADLSNIDGNTAADQPCLFVAGPRCTQDCGPDRDAVHYSLDTERLLAAVRAARQGADFVVMSFHWGVEYQTEPLPEYPALAAALTDAGVDVLLGHHPHVLQPVEVRTTARGQEAVIAYSLGNFVSNMRQSFDPARDAPSQGHVRDSVLLQVPLVRHADGRLEVGAPVAVPLWTQNGSLQGTDRITVRTLASMARAEPTARLAQARWQEIARIVGPSVQALTAGGPAPGGDPVPADDER